MEDRETQSKLANLTFNTPDLLILVFPCPLLKRGGGGEGGTTSTKSATILGGSAPSKIVKI